MQITLRYILYTPQLIACVNLQKNVFEIQAILELLVLGLSGLLMKSNSPFIGVSRPFEITPKIQILVWPLSQNFWLPWINKYLNDTQEYEGWIYPLNIK